MGDAHMAQGDSELDGTGIETSITGTFKLTLHKKADFKKWQTELDFPLGETTKPEPAWVVHGFSRTDYLSHFKDDVNKIFSLPTPVGDAMTNAFSQTRKFLMAMYGITDAEATTIITQGVDFGITQVVDGNFGVHAVIPKSLFAVGASDGSGAKVTTYGTEKDHDDDGDHDGHDHSGDDDHDDDGDSDKADASFAPRRVADGAIPALIIGAVVLAVERRAL
eukprot:gnl/TRDRNA2_/TRDRNA2_128479_c1_seq1.p1 gnl/TRDRNA2_/TRDRNA2_128479_c1~~gnl/TRDRNA2_/TRDRNA2_128479_c1_seq1.p1  ORF type:complete len:237 (+),score=41.98 gnl/TRDRNA2_/TRDRNA2_128479_c1_seq1:50-712(+)